MLSHEKRLKNALYTANNVILRFYFAQDQNKKYESYDIE
jgi:hypothetical protein